MTADHRFSFWIDFQAKDRNSLKDFSAKYQLHPASVQDCLDPEHYPKVERIGNTLFLIVRYLDPDAPADADQILALTRKIGLFFTPQNLLTIHRGRADFLEKIRTDWVPDTDAKTAPAATAATAATTALMIKITKECIKSYDPLIEKIERELLDIEKDMIQKKLTPDDLIQLYSCRSRLSLLKRLFWHNTSVIQQWRKDMGIEDSPWFQDLKEVSESYYFFADELLDDSQNLLNLQLSLASQKTNEVMRLLTVLSFFFLPLTFIVGVYGMNFRWMPELEWKWGYPLTWGIMLAISAFIYFKVRKRGWLDRSH